MQRRKYFIRNVFLFTLSKLGTGIISFLLVPLYTFTFSTSEYGQIDLVVTIVLLLIPLVTLEIEEAVMRFSLDDCANTHNIMSIGLLFVILSFITGSIVIFVCKCFDSITINSFLIYLYCVSSAIYNILLCNLRGQEKLIDFAVSNILNTFLSAIFIIILLVIFKYGVDGYFIGYTFAYIFSGTYCIFKGNIKDSVVNFSINFKLLIDMLKYSCLLIPNALMWWIMNASDRIMVTSMIGIAENGIYAISYKFPTLITAISVIFNQSWTYSAIHEDKSYDKEFLYNKMFDKLLNFQIVILLLSMLSIKLLFKFCISEGYYEAWKYTPFLFLGNFFLTLGTFLSTSYTVNKYSKGFLISSSIGAFLNLNLNFLLIPLFGIQGAAFSTFISFFAIFLYRYFDTKKFINVVVFKTRYILIFCSLFISCLVLLTDEKISYFVIIVNIISIFLLNFSFFKECYIDIKYIMLNFKMKLKLRYKTED